MSERLSRLLPSPASIFGILATLVLCHGAMLDRATAEETANRAAGVELFEKKIRPALIRYCYECHAEEADDLGGNLLLDTRAGWQAGGDSGPAIVAGKPGESLLMEAIEYDAMEMPPDQKLPDAVIRDFRRWIAMGAPDPRVAQHAESAGDSEQTAGEASGQELWSLQPIDPVAPPKVSKADWPRKDLDRFLLARLEKEGLQPSGDADPATLLRRVYFDLIGLPPSPAEVQAFVDDPSQEHLAEIVDSLLSRPAFGERWARHWLDVARYGESAGSSRDVLMIYAWRYRDFVIDAFNEDMPFDRFVTLQIAGDLLPAETPEQRQRQTVATGLLAIGSKSLNGGNLTNDIVDDQIDVVSKSVLGLTVSCARCHDHKFDPIPTRDYYSLAGIFLSTDTRYGGGVRRPNNVQERLKEYLPLSGDLDAEAVKAMAKTHEKIAELEKQVNASRKRIKSLQADVPKELQKSVDDLSDEQLAQQKPKVAESVRKLRGAQRVLQERLDALKQARAEVREEPTYALGVQDARKIADANVLIRGEKNNRGETVERGFLSVLEDRCKSDATESINDKESGRRQLAAWLVHPENPLTPRVAVNRVWQHLMGSGIVETVDNFGVSGQPPSHPQLLDFLADAFIHDHHWSVKSLIRQIVLSRAYQMSSAPNAEAFAIDPDNRLRWRMPRRRLEAEAIRDAMLSVSGLLEAAPLEGSLVLQIGEGEVGRNLDTAVLEEPFNYRSVYLPIIRGILPESLKLFDFPEPSNVQGLRDTNTTTSQSLYLMNSPFAVRVSRAMAQRLFTADHLDDDRQRVRFARRLCFGTDPDRKDLDGDLKFIQTMQASAGGGAEEARQLAWTTYCQSLIASAKFRFID